jgi:ABC-type transport system involved in multi-copper enzyme maturation permease subunit
MGRRILAIALNTYRESVRARILIGLAALAFAVAIYSIFVGLFTLRNALRVVSDLGAASISLFSIVVAIVIAATSLHRELEQKTIFPILARPITRSEYVVGKYAGMLLTLAVFVMADAGVVLMICAALAGQSIALVIGASLATVVALGAAMWRWPSARTFGPIPWAVTLLVAGALLCGGAPDERRVVLGSALLTVLEVGIVAGVGTLFSSFSTPFLSAVLTFGVFLIGRSADSLARLPVKYFGQALHDIGVVLSKIVPNLQIYVPPRPLLTGEAIDPPLLSYLLMASAVGVAWSVGLLTIASFIFKKRDFL